MFTEHTDAMKILYALLKVSSSKREIATWQHAREAHGPVGRAEDQTARGLEFNSPTVPSVEAFGQASNPTLHPANLQ